MGSMMSPDKLMKMAQMGQAYSQGQQPDQPMQHAAPNLSLAQFQSGGLAQRNQAMMEARRKRIEQFYRMGRV
jgi:hypothetical protein